jgi:uracil-DNA glycosylase
MGNLTDTLLATLPRGRPGLFNPWSDRCRHETRSNAAVQRIQRLRQHLECDARLILVGEAPGYQGCRYSGVAFTSERLLLEGAIPRIPVPRGRLSTRHLPFSEQSATIVWRALKDLGIQDHTILWNAVQLHPHDPADPWSNRTPTRQEVALGEPALRLLRKAFPKATFVPIGKKAEGLLRNAHIASAPYVRHPANGGATKFAQGLSVLVLPKVRG